MKNYNFLLKQAQVFYRLADEKKSKVEEGKGYQQKTEGLEFKDELTKFLTEKFIPVFAELDGQGIHCGKIDVKVEVLKDYNIALTPNTMAVVEDHKKAYDAKAQELINSLMPTVIKMLKKYKYPEPYSFGVELSS